MNLSFDYYHNLEDTDFYLCNPDGRELFPLVGFDRKLVLRFNDLSELTFSCYSTTTSSDGAVVNLESYEYVQTRRLIFATKIGWFVITNVSEEDNGVVKYKSVTCKSLQATLKDRGFYCEDRVYYLYNPDDTDDSNYNPDDDASIPSVVGQLKKQLGIQLDLSQGLSDPSYPYLDWTITYINSDLIGKARSFKESTTYGYDWIVGDVEDAFGVVVLFDFCYKTIHIMLPSEITEKANVIYSFSNFMKDIQIDEDADNIVTVMNCNGSNCDITTVNPTGTNYICDFSYYMDSAGRWMSSELKAKLSEWSADVAAAKSDYESKVLQLQSKFADLTSITSDFQEVSKIYTDLMAAIARKAVGISSETYKSSTVGIARCGSAIAKDLSSENLSTSADTSQGIVWAETVNIGDVSMEPMSGFYETPLSSSAIITAYHNPPHAGDSGQFVFDNDNPHITGTIDYCYAYTDINNRQYHYFTDVNGVHNQYCKLVGTSTLNQDTYQFEYSCSGFKRYVDIDIANLWAYRYDLKKQSMLTAKNSLDNDIASIQSEMKEISDPLNILNYFSDDPILLRELSCYWIEGDYTNDNISVEENMTPEDALDLSNELLESGRTELSKVCQPKIQFSLTSIDCTKQYEFRNQMRALELGKIITVEKDDGVWYYPSLLEIEYDLDSSESFSLKFANALRLDDFGYTYGDLVSEASSTSRQVSANWNDMISYSKDKQEISDLIKNPLSATLRAEFANAQSQEFIIDDTGIVGRKYKDDSVKDEFEDEQMRIINNLILFTDDNWGSVKTALGKIHYADPTNPANTITKYGLAAEVIVGNLILGNELKISNASKHISIDEDGITIKNGSDIVFHADTNGNVKVVGEITATSGIFSNCTIDKTCTIGSSGYQFHIGSSSGEGTDSPAIYSRGSSFPGMGSVGIPSDNYVYIGGDGFSYWDGNPTTFDYMTGIRPGVIVCSGDNNGQQRQNSAIIVGPRRLYFCYGGTVNLRTNRALEHVKGMFEVRETDVLVSGTFRGDTSGSIISDRNKKNTINDFVNKYDTMFDALRPVTYKYNYGSSGRIHSGFIAQEVFDAMTNANITTQEFAAYVEAPDNDGNIVCGLRYEEFISLNTWQIQKLKQRVSVLEDRISVLEGR